MTMTDEHKKALAEGRQQARAIRSYLEALQQRRPGRPVTPDTLRAKLARIESSLQTTGDVLDRVDLIQQRIDTEAALEAAEAAADMSALENAFVEAAASYSERKGITYAAWRETGVPAALLKRAGIKRGG